MDLIYAELNGTVIDDINVLQDYSFDEVYGKGEDVNDFELRVQRYNHKCRINNFVYVEFTEYGGIIDRIETNTGTGVIAYKGRTWHGILNSYVICPTDRSQKMYFSGEINAIVQQMLEACGVPSFFVVDAIPQDERSIIVSNFFVGFERLYDAILRLMDEQEVSGGKMVCYFHKGKVHIGVDRACNYSISEEFDTSQMPYKAGVTYNNVNHMICLGKTDETWGTRPCIHLFVNEDGEIEPYKLTKNPLEDAEYVPDERYKVFSGMDEITTIYSDENASYITNYKPLWNKPNDWNSAYYEKYYIDSKDSDGNVTKKLIPLNKRTVYRLQEHKPDGWDDSFEDFYYMDTEKEPKLYSVKDEGRTYIECKEGDDGINCIGLGAMTGVKKLNQEDAPMEWKDVTQNWGGSQPPDWETSWGEYYIPSGSDPSGKVAVAARTYETYGNNIEDDTYNGLTQTTHNGHPLGSAPIDWNERYTNYTTREKDALGNWVYGVAIKGVEQYHYEVRKAKDEPSGWKTGAWRDYYVKITIQKAMKVNDKIKTYSISVIVPTAEAIGRGQLTYVSKNKQYPKYAKNKYYVKVRDPDAVPSFTDYSNGKLGNGVYIKYSWSVAPVWDVTKYTYYKKSYNLVPDFNSGVFYKKSTDVEIIPRFEAQTRYYAVTDRIKNLVESGIEKLKELRDTDTLDIDLELESNYDIGDIIGCNDDVTGTPINKPILRKVIKIKKDLATIDYEVM